MTDLMGNGKIYKDIFNESNIPMIMINAQTGAIHDFNSAALTYFHCPNTDPYSVNIEALFDHKREEILEKIKEKLVNGQDTLRLNHLLPTGVVNLINLKIYYYKSEDIILLNLVKDNIIEEFGTEEDYQINVKYFDTLFNNSPEAIAIVDHDFKVLNINEAFQEMFQHDLQEIENQDLTDLLCDEEVSDRSYNFRNNVYEGKYVSKALKRQRKDGSLIDVILMAFPLVVNEDIIGIYCIYSDISETVQQKEKIQRLIYKDNLTGLFNKDFFLENLKNEILKKQDNKSNESKMAVLILNLNEFKEINEALGYAMGDLVFKEFSLRLKDSIGKNDIIARLNENRLAVMMPNLNDSDALEKLTKEIINKISRTFYIDELDIAVSTNIGISIYPDDGDQSATLIRKAEIALNKSKLEESNTPVNFKNSYDQEVQDYFWKKSGLVNAIKNKELFIDYQPVQDINKKEIVGVEALVRWNHKGERVVPPLEFIPIAEKTGMIYPIGEWVLRESCRQNKEWQDLGYAPIKVSVNVSILQLESPDFIELVKRILKETKLAPKYLQLEVTETVLTQDYEQIKNTINEISNLGINFSIDDFGTGYSSLGQLSELNINNLKVDKVFIDDVDTNTTNAKIVKVIISLAESLGITLIAEGVETDAELKFLKDNKCTYVQGYIFSKAVEPEKIETLLKIQNKTNT